MLDLAIIVMAEGKRKDVQAGQTNFREESPPKRKSYFLVPASFSLDT